MEIGELLGSGRTADVYALDGERVLRRYRVAVDARREAAVMAYVAGHGFPVPDVHPGESTSTDLVMARLSGPTMLRAMIDGEISFEEPSSRGCSAACTRFRPGIPSIPATGFCTSTCIRTTCCSRRKGRT
jgi:hypothetical protein